MKTATLGGYANCMQKYSESIKAYNENAEKYNRANELINEIHNLPIEEFYTSSVTPEVYDCFKNHTCVLRSLKKTAVDNIVSYICLYYELVFDESKNIAIEQGYLDKLASFESKNDETKTIFSQI